MLIKKLLSRGLISSDLIKINLPNSKSNIIQKNKGVIYCSKYKGLKGLFGKGAIETERFGRKICDIVKERMNNQGFFSSDELPNYGIKGSEFKIILKKIKADKNDLIVFFAYGKKEAKKTKDLLDNLLKAPNVTNLENVKKSHED